MISYLKNMMSKKPQNFALIVLLVIFIVFNIEVPFFVAELMDNVLGKILIIVTSLSLLKIHPLVGILGLVAGYVLIERISNSTGTGPMMLYNPSEKKKMGEMTALNQFPVTVEEEIIQKMIPMTGPPLTPPEFKPTQDSLHGAVTV